MKNILLYKLRSPFPQFLDRDVTLLLFRVLLSLSMINTHGMKKIMDISDEIQHIPDPFGFGGEFNVGVAIVGNIIGPILVILGFYTRLAIIPILGVTLVGLFVVHAGDPWSVKDIPLMYSLSYLFLFFTGAGKYSLDYKYFNKKK